MFFGLFGGGKKKINEYAEILCDAFIRTENINTALTEAEAYARENDIYDDKLIEAQKKALEILAERIKTADIAFPETRLNNYMSFSDSMPVTAEENATASKVFIEKHMITKALSNDFYEIDKSKAPVPIAYKANEKLHYICAAALMKKKRTTKGVNFGGLVGSVRICKGVRYRVGSLNLQQKTSETIELEDKGIFYITNMRIGYIGAKQFSIDLPKIVSLQDGEAGLYIFKQGRENPFMLSLPDYDVPCTIISCLLNQ